MVILVALVVRSVVERGPVPELSRGHALAGQAGVAQILRTRGFAHPRAIRSDVRDGVVDAWQALPRETRVREVGREVARAIRLPRGASLGVDVRVERGHVLGDGGDARGNLPVEALGGEPGLQRRVLAGHVLGVVALFVPRVYVVETVHHLPCVGTGEIRVVVVRDVRLVRGVLPRLSKTEDAVPENVVQRGFLSIRVVDGGGGLHASVQQVLVERRAHSQFELRRGLVDARRVLRGDKSHQVLIFEVEVHVERSLLDVVVQLVDVGGAVGATPRVRELGERCRGLAQLLHGDGNERLVLGPRGEAGVGLETRQGRTDLLEVERDDFRVPVEHLAHGLAGARRVEGRDVGQSEVSLGTATRGQAPGVGSAVRVVVHVPRARRSGRAEKEHDHQGKHPGRHRTRDASRRLRA